MKQFIPLILTIVMAIVLLILYVPVKVSVLGYHDFTDGESSNNMQVTSAKFAAQMAYLAKENYHSLTLSDLECFLKHTCKLPHKAVLITMDDGWKSELTIAAPILKEYNLHAVIFYVGSNYDGHNANFLDENDLKTIQSDYPNIEIASHSYDLHHDTDYLKSYDEIDEDFKTMANIVNTKYFAYPYGFYNANYEQVLTDNNYALAFTFGPGSKHRKVVSTDSVYEVPRLNISNDMGLGKFKLRLLMPF
jgi:peptidoglycan/xylan/chitin deacetylase (PgdA/CDA1 family)